MCNYCSNHYSCNNSGGTWHIKRHIKNKHKEKISNSCSVIGVCNFAYSKPKMRNGLTLYVAAAEHHLLLVMILNILHKLVYNWLFLKFLEIQLEVIV